jgi:proteasome lid subunit RPN8/RPN11
VRFCCHTFVAGLCLLQLGVAEASARPCEFPVFGEPHPSLEHAATAALRALYHAGGAYESGGFVIEQAGGFRSSKPVTQRSRSDVSYCIALPRGATLAGLYHTHVGQAAFSPRDRRNSERTGVPSFIGTIRDGALFVYDPQIEKVRALDAPIRSRPAHASIDTPRPRWLVQIEAALAKTAVVLGEVWNALGR